jgi:Na+-translocating ferredoxin:NAD+ oxidoreductase RnfG subunit
MTEDEALRQIFPEANTFQPQRLELGPAQLEDLGEKLGRRLTDREIEYHVARDASGAPLGVAFALDVIGKERPISFMLGVGREGRIQGVEVMVYRESEGSGIRAPRFRAQFIGKTLTDPLRIGRDIQNISGATLSSRATALAARKALALFRYVSERNFQP